MFLGVMAVAEICRKCLKSRLTVKRTKKKKKFQNLTLLLNEKVHATLDGFTLRIFLEASVSMCETS